MKPLTIIHLSWEFPPRKIGGLAAHVYDLAQALVKLGHNLCVITTDFPGAKYTEIVKGIHVFRFNSYSYPAPDFITWAL